MQTDRELLELAAKAAGLYFHGHRETRTIVTAWVSTTGSTDDWFCWNPLTHDGDALRLAVKLRIDVDFEDMAVFADGACSEFILDDANAATRRAIVRAAAEIGRSMQDGKS